MGRDCRLLLFFMLLQSSAIWAQAAPMPQRQAAGAMPTQVVLNVQVMDRSGAPVRGLRKDDFVVLDDKQPQSIVSFRAVDTTTMAAAADSDAPVEIILVVDAVNASIVAVNRERDDLKKFFLQNDGKLAQQMSLVFSTDDGIKVQNAGTRDGDALAAQLDQRATGLRSLLRSGGLYGAEDRFNVSLNGLGKLIDGAKAIPGRKLMIWLSPGWPLLSGPNAELSPKLEHQLFGQTVSFSARLQQADVTVYTVDPLGLADAGGSGLNFYKEFVKGVSQPTHALPGFLGLQVMAVQTGGLVQNSSNDLASELATCARDAESYYVLSFNAAAADNPNEYHAVAVRVEKPGITVRTRNGYYAQQQPPERPSNFNLPAR